MTLIGRVELFVRKNLANVYIYLGISLAVLAVYHLLSDGDFSFLMTLGSIFRMCAFIILLWKITAKRSASGVSLKTLQVYALVFACRLVSIVPFTGYLPYDRSGDWFYQVVEVAALALTVTTIVQVTITYKESYDASHDKFGGPQLPQQYGILYIVGPALVLSILLHPSLNNFWLSDVAWTFALYMEAVAILPQLYMFHRKGGEVESFTSHFVVCLGVARVMHFSFWLATHHELENRMSALPGGFLVGYVVLLSQLVHLLLMVDFFYYYFVSVRSGGPVILPTRV